MADSTKGFLDGDGEPSRKSSRRSHRGGAGAAGGNRDEPAGVKEVYGNIWPMTVRNIFNMGGQLVPFTIKWQKYLDVDFTSNQNPYIPPYQTLGFWTALWDSTSRNLENAAAILNISTGLTFLHSELTLEVYAITRLRLLQQGTTNVTTYNFETSENLYILLADRDLERYNLVNIGSCGPLAQHVPLSTGFHNVQNSYTKLAQIPHKMTWSRTFSWPQLRHGYMWRLPDMLLNNEDSFNYLMPGTQGEETITAHSLLTQKAEIIVNHMHEFGESIYTSNTIQPRVSYPRLHMGQANIPDETGFMKFRYAVRMSAETHVLFHLLPDHIWGASSRDFWQRQCVDLPKTVPNPSHPDIKQHIVVCLPFEIHNVSS